HGRGCQTSGDDHTTGCPHGPTQGRPPSDTWAAVSAASASYSESVGRFRPSTTPNGSAGIPGRWGVPVRGTAALRATTATSSGNDCRPAAAPQPSPTAAADADAPVAASRPLLRALRGDVPL
ncbi:hypothetical protein FOZ62_014425, partial [Perkinsus olseni]